MSPQVVARARSPQSARPKKPRHRSPGATVQVSIATRNPVIRALARGAVPGRAGAHDSARSAQRRRNSAELRDALRTLQRYSAHSLDVQES